jgi:hypothetical protein
VLPSLITTLPTCFLLFFFLLIRTNISSSYSSSFGVDASYNGSKVTRVPIPKVHVNGKINTKMENNCQKPMFSEPYVVINQLIKSI